MRRKWPLVLGLIVLAGCVAACLWSTTRSAAGFAFARNGKLVADIQTGQSGGKTGVKVQVYNLKGDWDAIRNAADNELTARGWVRLPTLSPGSDFIFYVQRSALPPGKRSVTIPAGTEFIQLTRGPYASSIIHRGVPPAQGIGANVRFVALPRAMKWTERVLAYLDPPEVKGPVHSTLVTGLPCNTCHRSVVAVSGAGPIVAP